MAGRGPCSRGTASGVATSFVSGPGEVFSVRAGLSPIRLGGTDFFPAIGVFGEPPGVALTSGIFSLGLALGATRLGGICVWLRTRGPVGDSTCSFLGIRGFGRPAGGGFCRAMLVFSLAASAGLMPCHPVSTTGLTKRALTRGVCCSRFQYRRRRHHIKLVFI